MTLTAEQTAVYTAYLADAEAAYHQYRMGQVVRVFVDQNGERIEYSATNIAGLRSYILELKNLLGQPSGIIGPLNVWAL